MHDRPHRQHAEQIVQQFREDIGEELATAIGDFHFGSLEVLIESALNTSVMVSMNDTITDLEDLLQRTRKRVKS